MRFEKIDRVPSPRCKLDKELDEFFRTGDKVAICHFEEGRYKNEYIAARTLNKGAKHWGYPIEFSVRKGKVYAIRTDM